VNRVFVPGTWAAACARPVPDHLDVLTVAEEPGRRAAQLRGTSGTSPSRASACCSRIRPSGGTFLARATAGELGLTLVEVATSSLMTALLGSSAHSVTAAFETTVQQTPALVFFDELDSIAQQRSAGTDGEGGGEAVAAARLEQLVAQELELVVATRLAGYARTESSLSDDSGGQDDVPEIESALDKLLRG
jgi:ATPase family associated with various cellular activities (AAA)